MKKIIVSSIVATGLALASLVGASYDANLSVGSTGSSVSALQSFLISKGFSIPAIASGAATPGYFGQQTKAAVVAYQKSVGLPSTGFVGPLTRGILNGSATVATGNPMDCPSWATCTPKPGTPVTPVTPGTPGVIGTPGVVGSLTAALWTSPSGVIAYKGQAYDVASYKIQASASDMALSNLTLDFDVRLWLYASSVTIKDDSGAVVGQVTGLNSSNFSELSVGNQYRLNVPVNNYVVRATQIKYLTVNITFLPTSDRATGSVNVTRFQVRSVDGTGVTDTVTVGTGVTTNAVSGTDYRPFTYQGSGAGSVVVTTNATSPATGLVQLSTSAQTQNVTLAIFDVKSQNAASTLRSLSVIVRTAGAANVGTLFSNIKLVAGGNTYSANSITANASPTGFSSSTVAFTSLAIPLAGDTYVPLKIVADVSIDTNNSLDGTSATTTLVAVGTAGATTNNPAVEDSSYSTLAVNSATFGSNALTFTGSGLAASNLAKVYGGLNTNSTTGTTTQKLTFNFSLTAGNNPIYLSKTQGTAITTSTNPSGITVTASDFSDSDTSGDGTTYFYLAPGQTKNFSAVYSASGLSTATGGAFSVSAINFGTSTTAMTTGALSSSDLTNGLKGILFQ